MRLEASTEGDRVRLRMEDDGRGIDPKSVIRAAVRQDLIEKEAAEALAPDEVMQLLFLPGLSTLEKATEVSGRGVGLDAVAAAARSVDSRRSGRSPAARRRPWDPGFGPGP